MSGRKKDAVWVYFDEKKSASGKFNKAVCKRCNKELMGLVARMKKHLETCVTDRNLNTRPDDDGSVGGARSAEVNEDACDSVSSQHSASSSSKANQSACKLNEYVIKTNATQKHLLDLQVARYFYATNTPFLHSEHEEFKKLISMLRPGYVPPTRFDIGDKLLDEIFKEEQNKCKSDLETKTVCLSIDGWSNIRNDPIVCSCVTANDGKTVLVILLIRPTIITLPTT